ncbi:MAG: hypothetical protein HY329_12690, partial [Chloroflexi bacterium]|nr:hypothetical protein [Chloroflexota bacterium]
TDGVDRYTGAPVADPTKHFVAEQTIRADAQTNTVAHTHYGRRDSYSGFLVQSNGASPSIMVVQGAKNDWDGAFSAVARKVAEHPRSGSTDYRSYVETALYSFNWAPNNLTQVGTTWFYMTTPGQSADGNIWDKRGYWSTALGSWNETFHVIVDPSLRPEDYLSRWTELTGRH